MAQKIAVIIMLIITVLLLTYFFFLVITGGKKGKLNFGKKSKNVKPVEPRSYT